LRELICVGAVICTPLVSEMKKVVANKKIVKVGLKATDVERANMTLEVDEKALNVLEQIGQVYIKWFS